MNRFFNYGVLAIDVIQFDAEITTDAIAFRLAQREVQLTGRGGTNFDPVLAYLEEHRDYDGLIVYTDGYAPCPEPPQNRRTRILWLFVSEAHYRSCYPKLQHLGQGAYIKCSAREIKFMRSEFNGTKENINLAMAGVSILVAVVALLIPDIRCSIPIVNRSCPKENCKLLFQQGQKIEYKYRRGDDKHIELGLVEELDAKTPGVVRGKVYLLKHPYPGDTDITKLLLPKDGTQYPPRFPNPVSFQISYKNDKWNFDYYYDVSGTTLESKGEGECINSRTARGLMKYPDNHSKHKKVSIFSAY